MEHPRGKIGIESDVGAQDHAYNGDSSEHVDCCDTFGLGCHFSVYYITQIYEKKRRKPFLIACFLIRVRVF
jgi:hypothetical protein